MRSLVSLILAFVLVSVNQAADTLDLIPADAMGGVALRNLNDLKKKGDALVKALEIQNIPTRPSDLFDMVLGFLRVKDGLDVEGSGAIVVVNRDLIGAEIGLGNLDKYLVVVIPFNDLDKMAGNMGLDKGKLKTDKMTETIGRNDFGKFCYVRGKHLFLGNHEKAILSVATGKTSGEEIEKARRKQFAEGDILIHLGTKAWGEGWKDFLRQVDSGFENITDESEKKVVKEFVEAVSSVRFGLGAIRLDRGFGLNVLSVFPKEVPESAKKFLTALRAGDGESSLKGLPEGNVVFAMAAKGDGTQNGIMARVFMRVMVQHVFEANRIFGVGDRPTLLNVFNEIWQRLRGSRIALYKTADAREVGLFSLIGVVETADPVKFLDEMKLLAKLGRTEGIDVKNEEEKKRSEEEIEQLIKDLGARRFAARESAAAKLELAGEVVLPYLEKAIKSMDLETSRRAERIKREIIKVAEERRKELASGDLIKAIKPSFAFLDKTEKMEGFNVQQVAVKLRKEDLSAVPTLKQILGPDWNRVRIAVHEKQVVMLIGTDVGLFRKALVNLKENKEGLASANVLSEQAKRGDPARKMEMHASVAMAAALATAMDLEKPGKLAAISALSSVALTVETDRIQLDLWIPVAELKAMVNEGMRGGQQP